MRSVVAPPMTAPVAMTEMFTIVAALTDQKPAGIAVVRIGASVVVRIGIGVIACVGTDRNRDNSLRSKDGRCSNRYKRTRPKATWSSAEPPKSLSGQSFASNARSLSTGKTS